MSTILPNGFASISLEQTSARVILPSKSNKVGPWTIRHAFIHSYCFFDLYNIFKCQIDVKKYFYYKLHTQTFLCNGRISTHFLAKISLFVVVGFGTRHTIFNHHGASYPTDRSHTLFYSLYATHSVQPTILNPYSLVRY